MRYFKFLIHFSLLLLPCLAFAQTEIESLIEEGIKLHDAGQYKEAIQQYKKAIKAGDASGMAEYEMGYSYYMLKDYDKALESCERTFKSKGKFEKQAYVLKGNILDDTGHSDKAIKTYEEALKDYPDDYLLYFNLALSYFRLEKLDEAGEAFVHALEKNSNHASSHLYLAKLKAFQGQRVPAIFSLYYFLMLEPEGARAEEAFTLLNSLIQKGTTQKDEKNIEISLDPSAMAGEFSVVEMFLSMQVAGNMSIENKDKPAETVFKENTEALFGLLGEQGQADKKGFEWAFYADFYARMEKEGHAGTFAYYICSPRYKGAADWMDDNADKFQAFADWVNK